jgi:hypothetical protein
MLPAPQLTSNARSHMIFKKNYTSNSLPQKMAQILKENGAQGVKSYDRIQKLYVSLQ